MITKDFQTAIVNRLASDAYFTRSESIEVKAEQRGFNTKKAVQDALNDRGVLVVVSYCKWGRDFRQTDDEFIFWCDVSVYENPKQNESNDGGTNRDGESCCGKAFALLHHYLIPTTNRDGDRSDPFSQLQIIPQPGSDGVGYLGERDAGIPVFGFRAQSKIYVDIEILCLGDPDAPFILVNENNQPLLISPTDP